MVAPGLIPPWGEAAPAGATTVRPTTIGSDDDTVKEYGDPSGQPAVAEAANEATVLAGIRSLRGSTEAPDSPTVTSTVTGSTLGLANASVTVPPWTAVVCANRHVVDGPGVPDMSASPDPDATTI